MKFFSGSVQDNLHKFRWRNIFERKHSTLYEDRTSIKKKKKKCRDKLDTAISRNSIHKFIESVYNWTKIQRGGGSKIQLILERNKKTS